MYDEELSFDVTCPDDVIDVLRSAAEKFRTDAAELAHCWQDRTAGAEWKMIAKQLELCADKIETKLLPRAE